MERAGARGHHQLPLEPPVASTGEVMSAIDEQIFLLVEFIMYLRAQL